MTKFELGRHIARSVLIKLANDPESAQENQSENPPQTADTSPSGNTETKKPGFFARALPHALDVAPALPLAGYLALADRRDPARLIGGLAGATGGYLANKFLGDKVMSALGIKGEKEDEAREFIGRILGGLNMGAMTGLGRLAGGAIAGRRPFRYEDLWHTMALPATGTVAGTTAGLANLLKK